VRWKLLTGVAASVLLFAFCGACMRPAVRPTGGRPTAAELAQLWIDPGASRNLFDGVGGSRPKPRADSHYTVLERDPTGFSVTYRVRDDRGQEWSVKIGPESQTEVVASRIVWAIGYHQVPSYFVERWTAVDDRGKTQVLGGGRFRPRPKDVGLDGKGTWSWQLNPFVGTRAYNGLLALMMIINSTDLKNDNNELYEVEDARREEARQWYVVKDLGATLGETGRFDPRRGYIEGFEREPFTLGVSDGFVRFAFRGRHQELLQRIGVEDVRWMSGRVLQLTDRQWRDAFRAGGYDEALAARFIARIKQKAEEGLALQ
jgi:hypothetical protein